MSVASSCFKDPFVNGNACCNVRCRHSTMRASTTMYLPARHVCHCSGNPKKQPVSWPFCPHFHSKTKTNAFVALFTQPLSSISNPFNVCLGNDWKTSFATGSITARASELESLIKCGNTHQVSRLSVQCCSVHWSLSFQYIVVLCRSLTWFCF